MTIEYKEEKGLTFLDLKGIVAGLKSMFSTANGTITVETENGKITYTSDEFTELNEGLLKETDVKVVPNKKKDN